MRQPTSELQAAVQADPALLSFRGRMPLTGGLPLVHAGTIVGGVGSSGGTPEEDVAVCEAAVAALAWLGVNDWRGRVAFVRHPSLRREVRQAPRRCPSRAASR